MKTRIAAILLAAIFLTASSPRSYAFEDGSFEAVAADVVLARPMCFVATVLGSVLFVVALPVAAISKSTSETAHTLVVKPARATFTRPLGDMTSLSD
jgi:hypothetical protein